jgi:hypothetical protein
MNKVVDAKNAGIVGWYYNKISGNNINFAA